MKRWIGICLLLISVCFTGFAQNVRVIHVEKPGALADVLPENDEIEVGEVLKITGQLEDSDFGVFKKLNYKGAFSVDLSGANVETIPYGGFSYYPKGRQFPLEKLILPSSVRNIENSAFAKSNISEIDLSRCSNLCFIGSAAFSECPNLQSVDFSECRILEYLGGQEDYSNSNGLLNNGLLTADFFMFSNRLEKVILPPNLKGLYLNAFSHCESMKEIEIPASLEKINGHMTGSVFTIIKMVMKSENPPSIFFDSGWSDHSQFNDEIYQNCVIEVPKGSLPKYKTVEPWNKFVNIKETTLDYSLTVNCSSGGSIEIEDQILQSGILRLEANTTISILMIPDVGYHVASINLNGVDVTGQLQGDKLQIESIEEDKELQVSFEKNAPVTYTVNVTYNAGGMVKIGEEQVTSGSSKTVTASTDVTVSIIPDAGYHVKSVKLGETDVTTTLKDNQLEINSISTDKDLSVTFEKDVPVTYTVNVTYNAGGIVKIGEDQVTSGSSKTVTASTDVTVSIIPNAGYHVKSVKLGETDVTTSLKDNQLEINSISTDKDLSVTFEKDVPVTYTVNVTYNAGGIVKIGEDQVTSGSSKTVTASADVTVSIIPDAGYHVKSVKLGETDVTTSLKDNLLKIEFISENKELVIVFEKDTPVNYTVKVTYNAGGQAKINNQMVISGSSISVGAGTDVQVSMIPNDGYLLKQVKLGAADVTDQIVDNALIIPEIAGDREITVIFEKGTPATCSVKVSYSDGGTVKVNNHQVVNGTPLTVQKSTKVSVIFIPNYGFYLKQVLSKGKDVTLQVIGNLLEMESVTEDLEIVAIFEKNPQVSCVVNVTGNGTVKMNGQMINQPLETVSVEKGSTVTFSFVPGSKYELGSVLVNNQNVTDKVKNNMYRISTLVSDITCQVEFVSIDDPTSIDQPENITKRVYRFASRCLGLSGFEAGVPVYVYDAGGRLVALKTIRESVEVVDVPADGLYFVRIGKESFKVIL